MDATALATVITAIGGAIGVAGGAYALVVKARGEADRPKHLLRRLWDWVEMAGHHTHVPHTLASEIRDELEGATPDEPTSP